MIRYERIHKFVFDVERAQKRKRDPAPSAEPPAKRIKVYHDGFINQDDYLRTCVKHQAINNLSFLYWDSETTRRFQSPFEKALGVSVSSKKMREHTEVGRQHVAGRIRDKLAGKLFCIKFDIGSRLNRSSLGVSIQFIEDYEIKISHLGMIGMTERATGAHLRRKIAGMQTNGLDVAQIYSSTTDNGGNVLNASREPLAEATTELINLFHEEDYLMTGGDMVLEHELMMALEQGGEDDQENCGWTPTRCAVHSTTGSS